MYILQYIKKNKYQSKNEGMFNEKNKIYVGI